MRIGVDARELVGRATGVGRYLGGLLHQWSMSRDAKPHEFVLYAPGTLSIPLDTRRFATREVAGSGGTYWEQVQVPAAIARDHLDVWFAPGARCPSGCASRVWLRFTIWPSLPIRSGFASAKERGGGF